MNSRISALIRSVEAGDRSAADELFSSLYAELHRTAARQLARGGRDLTLSPTTLLHEAYLDMSGRDTEFPDRNRFMAYAARVMRNVIVDYARRRRARKRGAEFEITTLDEEAAGEAGAATELDDIHAALERLEKVDASLAEVVDMKFFCGFSFADIAAMRGVSERTVQRRWEKARIYLHRSIRESPLA